MIKIILFKEWFSTRRSLFYVILATTENAGKIRDSLAVGDGISATQRSLNGVECPLKPLERSLGIPTTSFELIVVNAYCLQHSGIILLPDLSWYE